MKRFLFLALTLLSINEVMSQTVGISDVTFTPNTQAVLDLSSDRRGFLPPRMELNGDDLPINGTKPTGLMVYNLGGAIGPNGLYYWTGSAWTQITTTSNSIGGSGTLNYVPKFTPNGTTIGNSTIYDDGNVGISTTTPNTKLTVRAGSNSTTLTDYTEAISDKHGLMLNSSFNDGTYSPGLFWSTANDNPTKPKAGIFLQMTNAGSKMILGTSTTYSTGLTNTAMVINDLGNVGIGSTSPGTTLDVTGNARIGDATGGVYITSQGSSRVNLRPSIGNGNILISDDSGSATRGITVVNGGTVGIGTDVTSTKLHVYHATNSGVAVGRAGTPGSVAIWRYNGADTEFGTLASDGVSILTNSVQRIFVHSTTGNVGIGNNNSTELLDVSGKIRMRTGAAAGYIPVSDANGAMTWTDPTTISTSDDGDWTVSGANQYSAVSGNVGIGTSTPTSKLVVTGDITLGAGNVDNGTAFYTISPFSGASTINGGNGRELYVTAGPSDNNAARRGGHLYLRPGTPTSPATQYGTVIMADLGGNVGVGSSTANAKLHITGNGTEDGYLRLDYQAAGRYSTIAHTGSGMLNKVSNNGDLFYWQNASGTNLMAINPSTTNVGVGTTAPNAKLEVVGSNSDTPGAHQFRVGSNFGYRVDASTAQYLIMEGNNSGTWNNAIAINRVAGNVGIGTTNNTYKFQVNGDSRFSTNPNRYVHIGSTGILTSQFTDNNLIDVLDLRNTDGGAANRGTAIKFSSGYGTTPVFSGRIVSAVEGAWSSTASTQDAYMSFQTALNGNNVERMRIASNGNVGIGITDPIGRTHVGGNLVVQTQHGTYGTPGANYDALDIWGLLYSNNQDAGISLLAQNSSDYALWQGRFAMKSNSGGSPRIAIEFNNRNTSNVITSSVEAISIPSSGYVGMGTDAPSQKLQVYGGNIMVGSGGGALYTTGVGNTRGYMQAVEGSESGGAGYSASGLVIATSGGEAIAFKNGGIAGTTYMTITGAGRVGIGVNPSYKLELPNNSSADQGWVRAYSYATYSDKRLKTNVADLNYGLDAVMKLRPVSYYHHNSEFKEGSLQLSKEGANTFGLLAQEAYEVIPEMVQKPNDENSDLWSVDYTKLGPVLVKALQEQQAQIERLEREIQELKKRR